MRGTSTSGLTVGELDDAARRYGYGIAAVAAGRLRRRPTGPDLSLQLSFGEVVAECGNDVYVTIRAAVRLRGDRPLDASRRWRLSKRFPGCGAGRVSTLLDLDLGVVQGVTERHLFNCLERGMPLIRDLAADVRLTLSKLSSAEASRLAEASGLVVAMAATLAGELVIGNGGVSLTADGRREQQVTARQIWACTETCDRLIADILPDLESFWCDLATGSGHSVRPPARPPALSSGPGAATPRARPAGPGLHDH